MIIFEDGSILSSLFLSEYVVFPIFNILETCSQM